MKEGARGATLEVRQRRLWGVNSGSAPGEHVVVGAEEALGFEQLEEGGLLDEAAEEGLVVGDAEADIAGLLHLEAGLVELYRAG